MGNLKPILSEGQKYRSVYSHASRLCRQVLSFSFILMFVECTLHEFSFKVKKKKLGETILLCTNVRAGLKENIENQSVSL